MHHQPHNKCSVHPVLHMMHACTHCHLCEADDDDVMVEPMMEGIAARHMRTSVHVCTRVLAPRTSCLAATILYVHA